MRPPLMMVKMTRLDDKKYAIGNHIHLDAIRRREANADRSSVNRYRAKPPRHALTSSGKYLECWRHLEFSRA